MKGNSLEKLNVFLKAEEISDLSWEIVKIIPRQIKNPTANQFIRSADSIAANIAEGYGRYTYKERIHYCRIARGSLYESGVWLRRLLKRYKVPQDIGETLQNAIQSESYLLNQYIKYLKSQ